ncbi:SIR2 family NAD-dependent protein deacylase [Methylococcus capsulatus]|uniref:SIR2 family NAD-dependent protein deacylase n=1 Tax=Methylococcus capsulatus TaxID=414 RepID=UPI001C53221C|nr:NAD-dependent protein deacylase [Methylococcus capsulatus]QXP87709.1 NAD-dependent protein deacylase [Methylococcus capsulatus]
MKFSDELLASLRDARHIAVFTGAGVSAESGIPTFRDALTGLWENYDASTLASPEGFAADPALVWGWYEWRRTRVLRAEPNPAHYAIAALAADCPRLTLITQNVDDLHERAGSADPIRLHGSLHHPRCSACEAPYRLPPGIPDKPEGGRRVDPPRCARCGAPVRPRVVWLGENLPQAAWDAARQAAEACDLMFSIGTSALVWPAAQLPALVARRGATVVQVNPAETALDGHAGYNLRGAAGKVMPLLLQALRRSRP